MTKDEIRKTIAFIKGCSGDNEVAHVCEDDLKDEFIEFVAERDDELGELAKEVLKVNDLDFVRWYA